ncbi:hypothetical protein ON010_g17604 [Phytophthora cinnamomi]|nr:hypothetical protein ON010_g17604 [Phytophthora cinnamomi]
MLIYRALAVALLCAFVQIIAEANALTRPLNGWYPCSEFTFSNTTGDRLDTEDAECAVYSAPLCHPCEVEAKNLDGEGARKV